MNNITLIGRLTDEVKLKYLEGSGSAIATFSIAVKRDFAKEGQQDTDFINIEVWGKTAENCANYLEKGRQVAILGSLRIDKYSKDGENKSFTKVKADKVEFLGSGNKQEKNVFEQERKDFNEAVKNDTYKVSQETLNTDDIPF